MIDFVNKIPQWNLHNTCVLLRADLNVPLNDGKVISDFRLQAFKPTLDYLLAHGARVIILTHIGRPTTQDPDVSTRHLLPWFHAQQYNIEFAPTVQDARQMQANVVLLENLRFWPEESAGRVEGTERMEFARELATLGNYYVDDAFGAMHRNDTSITLLPLEFDPQHRSIGFLVARELAALKQIKENPAHPFVAILGGGKVHDKIPMLKKMIDKATTILLCPAIAFTFEKARGTRVGKSFVEDELVDTCRAILMACEQKKVNLILPVDYQVALNTLNGPLNIVPANEIPTNGIGISIGPKTLKLFAESMTSAQTIFFNGVFGFLERKDTLEGAHKLIELIAQSPAKSIIAGGDTAAVVQAFGLLDQIDYVSTGGGAALAYIAGEEMPGLQILSSSSS